MSERALWIFNEHDYQGHCSMCDEDYWTGDHYGILVLCPECYFRTEKMPRGGVPITGWPEWVTNDKRRIEWAH